MRLHRIEVEDVRGVARARVELRPTGVTVIEAPNESGKTTLLDALDLLLTEKASSKKQVVRDLQPAGRDLGSLVEAELSCGEVHLTVRKRFNRRPMTELEVHAPRARQLAGDEAHDELRRLLGDRTDLALYEALRFRQGRALESVALGGSGTLARRLDEIAGGAGDGGDDALLERIRQEFERYFTPKGQEGKVLKDVAAATVAARERRDVLAAQAREIEDDAARIAELERERRQLVASVAELEPCLDEHRRRLARVSELREQLARRQAEVAVATTDLERAERDRDARGQRSAALAELETSVEEREPGVAEVRARLDAARERLAEHVAAVETSEADERRARQALAAARDLAELGRLRDEVAALRRRRDRVEAAFDAAREAEAALAEGTLDDAQLEPIHEADEGVRLAAARLGDAAPTVLVRAEGDVALHLDGEETSLAAGEELERVVPEAFSLRLPGSLAVDVQAGASLADRQEDLAHARRRLDAACAAVGVADRAQADRLAATHRGHRRALEERDAVVARELGGIGRDELDDRLRTRSAQLEERETRVAAASGEPQLALDVDAAADRITALEADERAAREAAEAARRARDAEREHVQQLTGQLQGEEAELDGRRRRAAELAEQLAADRAERDDTTLAQAVTTATEQLAAARSVVAAAEGELETLGAEEIELLARNAEERLGVERSRLEDLREELTKLSVGVDLRGGEGVGESLQAAEVELTRLEEAERRVRARATAAATLLRSFEEARQAAYAAYREPLRERIVRAGRVVFGAGLDVELDEELAVVGRSLDGVTLDWDQLSAGAREQLAILAALAAADLAGGDGDDGVPLVLDDTLGYTDPGRLERLGAVLGSVRGPQVIVLTCVGERFRAIGGAEVVRLRELATRG